MKAIGIVRNIDVLGRIVLPMELRRTMGIETGDPIEIFVDKGTICLAPCKLQCVCCGSRDEDSLLEINGVHLCPLCIAQFRKEASVG